jgi:hypothetical protein
MKLYLEIDDLGVEYCDEGQWHSYALWASGKDVDEFLDSAFISEVDQDGGEITSYPVAEATNQVWTVASRALMNYLDRGVV